MDSARSLVHLAAFPKLDRRTLLRSVAGGLATGSVLGGGPAGAESASPADPETLPLAEVLWDTWGVPHIFAGEATGLFYGFGWAQAHAHAGVLLRLYAEARGRSAEFYGPDGLGFDQIVRTMGLPQRGEIWYGEQSGSFRANIDAFASGINDYAASYPDRLAEPGVDVLPITGPDVMAHLARILFQFVAGESEVLEIILGGGERGSNGWAIAPSHTANGDAMLLANPHLPWGGEYLFFEAQLTAPGIYDAYGATLVGIPVLAIAFNDDLGWTHTVNTIDGADVYRLTLDGDGYLLDGESRTFETRAESIKVRRGDGTIQEDELLVRRSVHGPVFESGAETLALRCTAVDEWASSSGALEQWWEMGKATNLNEFEAAMQSLQVPIFTVIYADREGHILSLFGGQAPVRPAGSDNTSVALPGDTSAAIWTEIYPYEALPKVTDPPGGWVQNSNSAPWYTTYPLQLDPDDFPPDIAPRDLSMREIRGIQMLMENPDMSFEKLIELKHSSRFELADRVLDDLIAAANASDDEIANRAAGVLTAWDRQATAESTGVLLFAYWTFHVGAARGPGFFAVPLDPAEPLTTPSGLADPEGSVRALIAAASEVESSFGRLDVAWGDVARLRAGDIDEPANGFDGNPFGVFRVLGAEIGEIGSGQTAPISEGDTFIAAVEFSTPVRAATLVTYGNASQPGSPHVGDQLKLAAKGELRPVWRTREEIEANLEFRESLG